MQQSVTICLQLLDIMASEDKTWQIPAEGSPCWVEIPARDIEKLKVGSPTWRLNTSLPQFIWLIAVFPDILQKPFSFMDLEA